MKEFQKVAPFVASFMLCVVTVSQTAVAKNLDDGKNGHDFGCYIGAVYFPERGACLEKPWNMERYKETLKTPPKPKTVSPKRVIPRGGGGGVTRSSRAGRGSYNLGSGYRSSSPSTGNSAGYGNFTFSGGGGGSGLRPAPMIRLK